MRILGAHTFTPEENLGHYYSHPGLFPFLDIIINNRNMINKWSAGEYWKNDCRKNPYHTL